MLQPDRGGIAGTSLLKLYAVTKEAKFLNAAVKIADAFKSTQLPDGRWVYRVNAKTGIVTDDYTSDQTEQILFLDRLVNEHGRQDFAACRDKAVQWMLENPAKTMLWPNSYEDTGTLKGPYANQQHWDTEYFIRYLMRHATPVNGYRELAEKLCQYVEDQFVIWETSGLPMWMGPGAKEKYSFPKVDVCGPLLRMYQDMHQGTGNPLYLEKAKLIANALTRYQLPNGFYPTFPVYGPGPDGTFAASSQANADSGQRVVWHGIWPNNVAYTGQWLLEFAHYLETCTCATSQPAARQKAGAASSSRKPLVQSKVSSPLPAAALTRFPKVAQTRDGKAGTAVTFPARTISWVRFTTDGSDSSDSGLAEFEVCHLR